MKPRTHSLAAHIMCAAVVAIWSGCAELDLESEPEEVGEEQVSSELTGCATVGARQWGNYAIPPVTDIVRAEFVARPFARPIDAVVGLSDGTASTFTKLAVAVRFNTSGTIDVRAGSVYRADRVMSYVAGGVYRFRLDIDVPRHIYSAYVLRPDGLTWEQIARAYPFRTEQAAVTRLNMLVGRVESATGSLELCNYVHRWWPTASCQTAAAGNGFANQTSAAATRVLVADITVVPSVSGIDAVFGSTRAPADAYDDLALSVRFAPTGVIDARRGDAYAADTQIAWRPGTAYQFRIVADIPSKTYSVYALRDGEGVELARNYAFRTSQSSQTALDNIASVVASFRGSVDVCVTRSAQAGVIFRRSGYHSVVPLSGDVALISDGASTLRVGSTGQILARVSRGGQLVVDAAGNVYAARVSGSTLTIDSMTSTFALRWSRAFTVPSGAVVQSGATTAAGDITYVLRSSWSSFVVHQIAPTGALRYSRPITANAVVPNRSGYALARVPSTGGSVTIEQYDRNGARLWTRSFAARVDVAAMTSNAAGQVLFAGHHSASVNFGGATIQYYPTAEANVNTYLVALSSSGAHVFSTAVRTEHIAGIASNGSRAVVSGQTWNSYGVRLYIFSATGAYQSVVGDVGFGGNGRAHTVTVAPSGRIYWNVGQGWPSGPTPQPQLVSFN